jgi:peptidoglycan/LPS O-acetylase OafA/YrhL
MSPVSLLPIVPILLITLSVTYFVSKLLRIEYKHHRYTAVDGLRGFLATFVFLHHSAIWYYFLRTHQWGFPPSTVYSHFGPTSVALFFMIAAFLFFSKLIDAYSGSFDWLKLYVSRVMRIMPLYLVAVGSLFVLIGFVSHFVLHEPFANLSWEFIQWMFFIETDVNLIYGTKLVIAGVVWSLTFEWMFYFTLALNGAIFFRIKTPATVLAITGVFLAFFIFVLVQYYPFGIWRRISPFAGGIVAAFLVRNSAVRTFCSQWWLSPFLLLLLIIVFFYYPTVFELVPYLCIMILFIAIANGNDLFGILTTQAACLLGQISYGIYLLHGMVLFFVFRFLAGFARAAAWSPVMHWIVIAACGALVAVICSLTYQFVEKPGIDRAGAAVRRVRAFLANLKNSHVRT